MSVNRYDPATDTLIPVSGTNNHLKDEMVAEYESTSTATHAYEVGGQFIYNGKLYEATSAISVGGTIITEGANANCVESDSLTEQIAKKGSADNFIGTKQQWDALTPEEQAKYKTMDLIGDNIGGGGGHTIVDEEGTELTQRSKLQFKGAVVSDDETNDATVVETVNPVEYEEDIYGVNLIPYPYYRPDSYTMNGITFIVNSDGSITANGTATGIASFGCVSRNIGGMRVKVGEQYIISGCPQGGAIDKYYIVVNRTFNGSADAIVRDYGDGQEFTLTESDEYYGVYITIINGQTVTNLTFKPMLRKVTIKDDTYRPFNQQSIQHQLTEQTNVLGSKNLLQNTATSQVVNGVTFTVNDDGSVSTSGTANADIVFVLSQGDDLPSEDTILSGCPFGGSEGGYKLNWASHGNDYGGGVTIPYNDNIGQIRIQVKSGTNMNGKTFRPMLRLASDPDDTYVPYAMTNREITEKMAVIADLVYPVGSIYMSVNSTSPAALFGGTWERIAQGRCLFGADDSTYKAGDLKNAGLPNITGYFGARSISGTAVPCAGEWRGGAFNNTYWHGSWTAKQIAREAWDDTRKASVTEFNAAASNSIYGNSSTVQPPALVVYMWKRTA